jgi:hypothetical protein
VIIFFPAVKITPHRLKYSKLLHHTMEQFPS